MRLLLVQHGVAMSKEEDPDRPLRSEGADTVSRMAAWGARQGLGVHEIRHSGKRRAAETAEIFGVHLHPALGVRVAAGLAPLARLRRPPSALQTPESFASRVAKRDGSWLGACRRSLSTVELTCVAHDGDHRIRCVSNDSGDEQGWRIRIA